MSTPEQLNQFINDTQDGNPVTPQTPEESLVVDLMQLANQFDLSPEFDADLMAQFKPEKTPLASQRWMRLTASIVLGLIGISVLIMAVPPLRVWAGEILNDLFRRDTESIKVYSDNEGRYAFSDDTMSLSSVDDVKYVLDYELALPDYEQWGYQVEQVSILRSRNSIAIFYSRATPPPERQIGDMTIYTFSDDFLLLQTRQQPLEDSQNGVFYFTDEQDTIAPIAETTPVSVGGYHGELVQGEWFSSTISGKKHFYWKKDAPVYRVRWQDETFLYEVELWSDPENAHDEILAIAGSMMD